MTYKEFKPTSVDGHIDLDGREAWLVAPVSINRDTEDSLTLSNWASLREMFPESETVEIHRFGHWGPGWFELMLLDPCHAKELEDVERALEDYPVLDDEKMSEIEREQELEAWDNCWRREFTDELREVYPEYDDLPSKVTAAIESEAQSNAQWDQHADGPYLCNMKELVDGAEIPCPQCLGSCDVSPERSVVTGLEMLSPCPDCDGWGTMQPQE